MMGKYLGVVARDIGIVAVFVSWRVAGSLGIVSSGRLEEAARGVVGEDGRGVVEQGVRA